MPLVFEPPTTHRMIPYHLMTMIPVELSLCWSKMNPRMKVTSHVLWILDMGDALPHACVPLGTQATWNCAPRAETAPRGAAMKGRWLSSYDTSWSMRAVPGQPDAGKCPSNLNPNPYLRWWKMCWIYIFQKIVNKKTWFEFKTVFFGCFFKKL